MNPPLPPRSLLSRSSNLFVVFVDLGLPGASDRMQWFVVYFGCCCLKRVSEVVYVKP